GVEAVDRSALVTAPPVRQQPAARRPSHRLEIAVDAPKDRETDNAGRQAGGPVHDKGQNRAGAHDTPATELVAEVTVDRLADGIAPQQRRAGPPERSLADAELRLNAGNGETECLPSRVEEKVAKHRRQQHPPLRTTERGHRMCQAQRAY